MERAHAARAAVDAAVLSGNTGNLQALSIEVGNAETELSFAQAQVQAEIFNVLTAEQKQKIAERRKAMEGRRGEMMKRERHGYAVAGSGSGFQVASGSGFGFQVRVQSSKFSSEFPVDRNWESERPEPESELAGTRNSEPGTRNLEPGFLVPTVGVALPLLSECHMPRNVLSLRRFSIRIAAFGCPAFGKPQRRGARRRVSGRRDRRP